MRINLQLTIVMRRFSKMVTCIKRCNVDWLTVVSNFVQIPNMPNIPDDQKPAISKVIAPAVLFGSAGEHGNHHNWLNFSLDERLLVDAIQLGLADGVAKHTAIGIGMWLGAIMWFNVWFVIWPNQKKPWVLWKLMLIQRLLLREQLCYFQELIHCCLFRCYMRWWQPKIFTKINYLNLSN